MLNISFVLASRRRFLGGYMSKLNDIQNAILQLEGGRYQNLMDCYLYRKYGFTNITSLGSETGTDKPTKGIPDAYVRNANGKYVFIMYGTVKAQPYLKIQEDILSCLSEEKTGVNASLVEQIICCHTSSNIGASQNVELHKLFHNLTLIGISDLSQDLLWNYHNLAQEYLAINADTNQILTPEIFIEYTRTNTFATPLDTPCEFRENDILNIHGLLQSNLAIYISGASGTGKTRLALAVASKFQDENGYEISIIKSNGLPLYGDLSTLLHDDKSHIIIVDDANQLSELKYLFDVCSKPSVVSRVRILLTVRDYAKKEILSQAYGLVSLKEYSLKPLSDNQVTEIIAQHFEIKNPRYQEQIVRIAKGNIRIAIIASMRAKEGSFDDIMNIAQVYQWFFQPIWEKLDLNELLTAIIVAFFETVILKDTDSAASILEAFHLTKDVFVEKCLKLHSKEVVSAYQDLVVRFEQQNFRDYLLYYTFIEKKLLKISDIVVQFFPKYRDRIIYVLNTILNLFYSRETLQYLNSELLAAWQKIKLLDDASQLQFVLSFSQPLGAEALIFVKNSKQYVPNESHDFSNYSYNDNNSGTGLRKDLLQILSSFKYSEYRADSYQLLIELITYSTKDPDDYFYYLKNILSPDSLSFDYRYIAELSLVDAFIDSFLETKSLDIAYCLLFYVQCCLRFSFNESKSNGRNTITYQTFGYGLCDESIKLRNKCIEVYGLMLSSLQNDKYVLSFLYKYSYLQDSGIELLKADSCALTELFKSHLSSTDINHCIIFHKFRDVFIRNRIEYDPVLLTYKENPQFFFLTIVMRDRFLNGLSWEESEKLRKQEIRKAISCMSVDDFELFFSTLSNDYLHKRGAWEIQSGIISLFQELERTPDLYIAVLSNYLKSGAVWGGINRGIVAFLLNQFGYVYTRTLIDSYDFEGKSAFLAFCDEAIPDELIDHEFCDKMLDTVKLQPASILSLATIVRIDKKHEGFLIHYTSNLIQYYSKQPNIIASFLDDRMNTWDNDCTELVQNYSGALSCLEQAYIIASKSGNFDYKGNLLLAIVNCDIDFIPTFFRSLPQSLHDESEKLILLWNAQRYSEIIDTAVEATGSYFLFASPISCLFTAQGDRLISDKQEIWLKQYIEKNITDVQKIRQVFGLLEHYPIGKKKELILFVCEKNRSFEIFKSIPLYKSSYSWSGSQIPVIDAEIEYFEGLCTELSRFTGVFEHKAYINERINSLLRKRDQVLLEEFVEGRAQV